MDKTVTKRGFQLVKFKDNYYNDCSLQEASDFGIWLGIEDVNPQILASKVVEGGTGWVKYPIPDNVLLTTRMHLTQDQVKELLPYLIHFAETGELWED